MEDLIDDAGQWYELSQHGHVAESLAMSPDVATRMYVLTKDSRIKFLLRILDSKIFDSFQTRNTIKFPGFATCRPGSKSSINFRGKYLKLVKKHNYL